MVAEYTSGDAKAADVLLATIKASHSTVTSGVTSLARASFVPVGSTVKKCSSVGDVPHSAADGTKAFVLLGQINVLVADAEVAPTNAIAATAATAARPNILMSLTITLPSRRVAPSVELGRSARSFGQQLDIWPHSLLSRIPEQMARARRRGATSKTISPATAWIHFERVRGLVRRADRCDEGLELG
jgi:hypothetical protein